VTAESFLDGKVELHCGDSRDVLRGIADGTIDSCVCDPPYALVSITKRFGADGAAPPIVPQGGSGAYARASAGFMGKKWDTGETAFATDFWAEVLRVLKPGGHVVAFAGTRTYHRLACAVEDAGFEIRDQIGWLYGSGFPKSHDVAKQIDKGAGHWRGRAGVVKIEEQVAKGTEYERTEKGDAITPEPRAWSGWGTALKPAWEPVVLARKPLIGTVVGNVLEHGTGAINIDGCRVGDTGGPASVGDPNFKNEVYGRGMGGLAAIDAGKGRWPTNVIHDGCDEVIASFPTEAGGATENREGSKSGGIWSASTGVPPGPQYADSGSAARFFYTAKADADDRIGSKHPTVKPVDLMQYLVRLVTPKGGTVLDPFAGTGTTGEAAFREGMRSVLIEREKEYQADIRRRMALALAGPEERARASIKEKLKGRPMDAGPLFGGTEQGIGGGAEHLRSIRGRTIGPMGLKR
jgi:site-specific DNA-methyltransferase (adenine-specific)